MESNYCISTLIVKKISRYFQGQRKSLRSIITLCQSYVALSYVNTESGLRQGYIEVCANESGERALAHTLARVDRIRITSDKRTARVGDQKCPHKTGSRRT